MVFALTEKLLNDIVQALENQERLFVLDAENLCLVSAEEVSADDDIFYTLPEWKSSDGFSLMEDFVSTLHSPIAKDELQRTLHSGRGVFRNFKNVLKKNPEVEVVWHQFKNARMHSYINEWYNQLREIWGLERLAQEPEETGDLIQNDFVFEDYSSSNCEEVFQNLKYAAKGDFGNPDFEELDEVLFDLWLRRFESFDVKDQTGIVCRSNSEEFAGCITASPAVKRTDDVVILTSFYVPEKFRGLGIGTELLERVLNALKDKKKHWILLTDTIIPESLMPLLIRNGFEKIGSGFAARIL